MGGETCGPATQEIMDGSPAEVFLFSHDDNSSKTFARIKFQLGAVNEVGENGTQIEDVLGVIVNRLESFQKGPFRCKTNAMALNKLQEAIMWLEERTKIRVSQGVEGTNQEHKEVE